MKTLNQAQKEIDALFQAATPGEGYIAVPDSGDLEEIEAPPGVYKLYVGVSPDEWDDS